MGRPDAALAGAGEGRAEWLGERSDREHRVTIFRKLASLLAAIGIAVILWVYVTAFIILLEPGP